MTKPKPASEKKKRPPARIAIAAKVDAPVVKRLRSLAYSRHMTLSKLVNHILNAAVG